MDDFFARGFGRVRSWRSTPVQALTRKIKCGISTGSGARSRLRDREAWDNRSRNSAEDEEAAKAEWDKILETDTSKLTPRERFYIERSRLIRAERREEIIYCWTNTLRAIPTIRTSSMKRPSNSGTSDDLLTMPRISIGAWWKSPRIGSSPITSSATSI